MVMTEAVVALLLLVDYTRVAAHTHDRLEGEDLGELALKVRSEFNERVRGYKWDSKEMPIRDDELLCYCDSHCDRNLVHVLGKEYSWVCRARPGGRCRRSIHLDREGRLLDSSFTCVTADQLHPPGRPFMCAPFNRSGMFSEVECCTNTSFCNYMRLPSSLTPTSPAASSSERHWYFLLLFGVAVVFSGIGLSVGIYCERPKRYLRSKIDSLFTGGEESTAFTRALGRGRQWARSNATTSAARKSRLDKLLDDLEMTASTGSGAGMPLLAQRTIARQITLGDCIGRGRFGEVYIGEWRGEKVAVKIFLSRDESSWDRETEIYRTNMLRHSNLLRWIASDNKDTGTATQLWLITEYLPQGSLFDHLERQPIDQLHCLQFIRSVAHGLAYLHTEVVGLNNAYSKPGIAHRDLKTKNILLKNDMTCVIADLGLAVRCKNGSIDLPASTRGGTARYLAPEFLAAANDNSNDANALFTNKPFNSFLQMDVYAFALVMWEIGRSVQVTGSTTSSDTEQSQVASAEAEHEIPYFEHVPREPEIEDMRRCVVDNKRRPSIPDSWRRSEITSELTRIIEESWATNPNSRLTALNIRYSIDNLVSAHDLTIVT